MLCRLRRGDVISAGLEMGEDESPEEGGKEG